ncbi:MAG: DNA adenine methylase [Acidobacteria bacterium]|nr:DNA adenine methylase [Acidobacteriota bacterium]
MKHVSPLRYPGGKASLSGFLTEVIDQNDLRGSVYYEPYAGGAGAALTLLKKNVVSQVYINDADQRIFAFWQASLRESERFIDLIRTVPLTINEWRRQREICTNPQAHEFFDVGFAAFYMNRCNRSGVLIGAGPIGGEEQAGVWRMDVRFNREELASRIAYLARARDRIHVFGLDAIAFLKNNLPKGNSRSKVFTYLDPPYVDNGQKLYFNAYKPKDHAFLTRYLSAQTKLPWLVSYDNHPLVRKLYAEHQLSLRPIRYTLQEKRTAKELIIAPKRLALPDSYQNHGRATQLQLFQVMENTK